MIVGIPKESAAGETRVAATPASVKKLKKMGLEVLVQSGAGSAAHIRDEDYKAEGAQVGDAAAAFGADIVYKIQPPTSAEIGLYKKGAWAFSLMVPYLPDNPIAKLAQAGVNVMALELLPRTSRAQSMDVLSSQGNIAGYRACLEAGTHYPRFVSMMMTSAGASKPAKGAVLGAGVAGLQAIATLRKMGSTVEAFDVRPEVKEQIQSLGAKFMELDLGETGSGSGGYAKELSEEGKKKQQQALTEKLKGFDIVISTANIPGRKSPTLITEEAVRGMRPGSVIVDLAAANGGNCPLTEAEKVVVKHGVTIVGYTNYPAMMPFDSSQFFANNLNNLLALIVAKGEKGAELKVNFEDDIVAGTCAAYQGELRFKPKA